MSHPVTLPTSRQTNEHVRQLLTQHLTQAAVEGRLVPYSELNDLIHDDVRTAYRSSLSTVTRKLLEQHGIYFKAQRGVGLYPVSASENLSTTGVEARKKINNETSRWEQKYKAVDAGSLESQEDLREYIREQLRLNLQKDLNAGSESLRIEAAVEPINIDRKAIAQARHHANERMKHVG